MKEDIKQLNTALKGEHMAILGFDHYIKSINDPIVKARLQVIQKRHLDQASKLSSAIQSLDGNPINNAGLAGSMQELKYRLFPKSNEVNDIVENAMEGEEMGISALEEISKNINSKNKEVINQIIAENKRIVKELYQMTQ